MKKTFLSILVIITAQHTCAMTTEQETMCSKASQFLREFDDLKAQPLRPLNDKDIHFLYTRNRIIEDRSPQLRKIEKACNENKMDSVVNQWKDVKFLAKNTLKTAAELTNFLQKNS